MTTLATIAGLYLFIVFCWVLYLAIMNIAANRNKLGPIAKVHAYMLLGVGYILDAILNVVLSLLLFLDRPRSWLFTGTLVYHLYVGESDKRRTVAQWICTHLLDPFDPKGSHCRR